MAIKRRERGHHWLTVGLAAPGSLITIWLLFLLSTACMCVCVVYKYYTDTVRRSVNI